MRSFDLSQAIYHSVFVHLLDDRRWKDHFRDRADHWCFKWRHWTYKNFWISVYSEWEFSCKIENAIEMVNQSISNYSFLWEYRNSNSQKFLNLMLTLFTIVVGYPSLKNVFEEFLPNAMIALNVIFALLLILFTIKMIRFQFDNIKESSDFKKRRH